MEQDVIMNAPLTGNTETVTVGCQALKGLATHSNILLLQGPIGPFFSHLANFLSGLGRQVTKVNFNGGDALFYRRKPCIHYSGSLQAWPAWIERYLQTHHVEAIALFGEWRTYHRTAWDVADRLGIKIYVFEEGYLRPDYITLEPHGVNGNSLISRDASHYRALPLGAKAEPKKIDHRFSRVAAYAISYYLATVFMTWRYPAYQHHRRLNPLLEGLAWIRSGWRKQKYALIEKETLTELVSPSMHKRYYLVPLQVRNDSQVKYHSPYDSVEAFMHEVVASFARHAPKKCSLVLKHHPMDRGYIDYTVLVQELAQKHALGNRLIYIHDGHLPTLQKHARGVVTINSTVGLSAFYHHIPVKIMGEAIYSVPGLVSTASLEEFWQSPGEVDEDLFLRFKRELIRTTQLNASFYQPSSYPYAFICVTQEMEEARRNTCQVP